MDEKQPTVAKEMGPSRMATLKKRTMVSSVSSATNPPKRAPQLILAKNSCVVASGILKRRGICS